MIRKLCSICGADLKLWEETFHEPHHCPTPELDELQKAVDKALALKPIAYSNQSSLNQLLGEFQAKGYRLIEVGRLYKLLYYDELVFGFDHDIPVTKATVQATCWLHERGLNKGGKI